MPRRRPFEQRMSRFLREPPSVRLAAGVIVTATVIVVVGSGVLISLVDHAEYPTIWVGMWWAIQTVTTVGYGDVTPSHPAGRLVAVFVMLEGIAFLAITTAAITSSFVARAERERSTTGVAEQTEVTRDIGAMSENQLDVRLGEIAQRLERLETMVRELAKASPDRSIDP